MPRRQLLEQRQGFRVAARLLPEQPPQDGGVGRSDEIFGGLGLQPRMVAVERPGQHGGVNEGLHGSAPSSMVGKAVEPGRIDSDRASRSAAIIPVTSTGTGASPPR